MPAHGFRAMGYAFARRTANLLSRSVAQEPLGHDFERAVSRVQPYTMTSRERMYALWQAVDYVVRSEIEGDFVECGVWRGGSSMLAALAFAAAGDARSIWMYDTYAGMTTPTGRDRLVNGQLASERLAGQDPKTGGDWAYASLRDVRAHMASVQEYPTDRLHFVEGPVEQTIPTHAPEDISILRLDTDWYASTKHELVHLWPRLTTGGVLIVDDYGHWQGAREAVDEYIAEHQIDVLLHRIDYTGRAAVKLR